MTIDATPTSVEGEQEIKLTVVLNATQPIISATLRSGQGFGGKVFGGDDASLEYLPESVTVSGVSSTTVSGGLESSGLLFSNLPAGDTTIRLRAKTSPGRLRPGQREPITDMLELRDSSLLTGRVLASETFTVTVQPVPIPGSPSTPGAPPSSTVTDPGGTGTPPPTPENPGGSSQPVPTPGGTTNPGGSTTPGTTSGTTPGSGTNPQGQGGTTVPPPTRGGSTPVGSAGTGAGPFPDVPLSHPAAAAITKLKARGALQGYESGLFGPDGSITRAEVAKILMLATNTPAETSAPLPGDSDPARFPSEPPYQRFADAIRTAVARGWMSQTNESFLPWASVKDVDAKTIISRATSTTPTFGSQAPITRAQFCIELAGTLGL